MNSAKQNNLRDEVGSYLQFAVAAGFDSAEEMVTAVTEIFSEDADGTLLEALARSLVRDYLAAHIVAQTTWPALTDCDRLDAAFAELEAHGIVCRQNFSCCGSCGSAEIWDEAAVLEAAGRPVRGYAFYHVQDTESAVEGHGLYLNYGAADAGEAAALGIAYEIVDALRRHGLRVNWEGKWSRRIGVDLDWKRRRTVPAA